MITVPAKKCSMCGLNKPLEHFGTFVEKRLKTTSTYRNARCKDCARAATNAYRKANRAKITAQRRALMYELRDDIYAHYGGKCHCCGESTIQFLTLEHKNDDGHIHRAKFNKSQWAVYKDIKARGYPDDITVACYNCNCGRTRNNGVCPHNDTSSRPL